jgi:transcriptional regulator with XRE-family HTH domain
LSGAWPSSPPFYSASAACYAKRAPSDASRRRSSACAPASTANYIGGIERGERNPSVTTIATLADALELKLSELFARTGN